MMWLAIGKIESRQRAYHAWACNGSAEGCRDAGNKERQLESHDDKKLMGSECMGC